MPTSDMELFILKKTEFIDHVFSPQEIAVY